MLDFLYQLEPLHKAFWIVALFSSFIFLFQTILTFIGSDFFDVQTDIDEPFQLFSLRNLINFLLGFSWSGISMYQTISNKIILVLIAFLIGLGFLALFFLIIKQIINLSEDNSFKMQNCVGKTAEVYLKIPATRSGFGKVLISVNSSVHELAAITNGEEIENNTLVKIIALESNLVLLVEKV